MKYLIPFAALALSATSAFAVTPDTARTTLWAEIGGQTVYVEAPRGMCFFDTSYGIATGVPFQTDIAILRARGDEFLGIFTDCNDMANLGGQVQSIKDGGIIVWHKPKAGEHTPKTRDAYFDRRADSFMDEVKSGYDALYAAEKKEARKTYGQNFALAITVPDPETLVFSDELLQSQDALGLTCTGKDFAAIHATTQIKGQTIDFKIVSDKKSVDELKDLSQSMITATIEGNEDPE